MSKKHKLEIVARSNCGGYHSKNLRQDVVNWLKLAFCNNEPEIRHIRKPVDLLANGYATALQKSEFGRPSEQMHEQQGNRSTRENSIIDNLAFALANGKPAEPATAEENLNEPVKSRDSRQMMLPAHAPYYYVPYRQYYQPQQHQQPSMAQNFGNYLSVLIRSLDPGAKERLI
uniref:Uncharacterized protein n=1 Tax=Daphnia galeata TaxID=27404 RepID=A0A8J2RCV0_9CRUS|nr:unnamed protein product [Daphnia galeata]